MKKSPSKNLISSKFTLLMGFGQSLPGAPPLFIFVEKDNNKGLFSTATKQHSPRQQRQRI
jgi:hypothetical protein